MAGDVHPWQGRTADGVALIQPRRDESDPATTKAECLKSQTHGTSCFLYGHMFTGGRAAGCNQKKGRENRKKTKIDTDHTALDKPPRRVCSAKLNTPDFFHLLWQAAAHMAHELKNKDNAHILSYIMQNDPHLICKFPEILLNTFCSERIHLNLQLELSCIINEKRQFLAAY